MLMISGAMKTTPTDALEVLLDISPLLLFLESEAILENYRNEISELPEIQKLSDLNLKRKYEGHEWLSITHMYYMKSHLSNAKLYDSIYPTRKDWANEIKTLNNYDMVWYTDGSKTEICTGAAVY